MPADEKGRTIVYVGTWSEGKKQGSGIETTTYQDGSTEIYDGDFENDMRAEDGTTMYTTADGQPGVWVEGEDDEDGHIEKKQGENLPNWRIALRKAFLAKINGEGMKLKEILKTLSDTTKIGKGKKTWKSTRPFAMKDNFET